MITVPRAKLLAALALAWPASLAAMITPALGLIDTYVMARAATAAEIAGLSLAGGVFSILYWTLGFLRMSLSGLTAQADGREDEAQARAHLVQGVAIGAALGLPLALFAPQIASLSTYLMTTGTAASASAAQAMETYVQLRLLAAPLAIASYAAIGWLTGQGRTGLMMVAVVAITGVNAVLDVWFVLGLDWGVEGIAIGTALAEGAGALFLGAAVLWVLHRRGGIGIAWVLARFTENWRGILSLNVDIMLRTLCLAVVFTYFTRAGGQFGDLTLAANQVLMHLVLATGLLLDGPAIAAEAMVGKAIGATTDKRRLFDEAVASTTAIAAAGAVGLTVLLALFGDPIIEAIVPTDAAAALNAEASRYYFWAVLSPLFMLPAFHLDGIYIGAVRGDALRNSMIGAGAAFALAVLTLPAWIGNHGLWLAFGIFMAARAVFLLGVWRGFSPLVDRPMPGQAGPSRGGEV